MPKINMALHLCTMPHDTGCQQSLPCCYTTVQTLKRQVILELGRYIWRRQLANLQLSHSCWNEVQTLMCALIMDGRPAKLHRVEIANLKYAVCCAIDVVSYR